MLSTNQLFIAFSALKLLVEHQEVHPAWKELLSSATGDIIFFGQISDMQQ